MGEQKSLLKRLKDLVREQGKILLVDEENGDLFALSLVNEDNCCGGNCDCNKANTQFNIPVENMEEVKNVVNSFDEEELMKRVNEDIAKWRTEEEKNEKKVNKLEEEAEENSTGLMEEERYYLEPLE